MYLALNYTPFGCLFLISYTIFAFFIYVAINNTFISYADETWNKNKVIETTKETKKPQVFPCIPKNKTLADD